MQLIVSNKRLPPVINRHPWVFSGALVTIPEGLKSGQPVDLADQQGKYLASGYFNSYSQIAVRIWTYDKNEAVNKAFFQKRIVQADQLRKQYLDIKKTNAYRLINSENDFLPGLIVDKYGDYLVIQYHTRGIEQWNEHIIDSLVSHFSPKGIYERSDLAVREIEKAEKKSGLIYGQIPDKIKIKENGWQFWVDLKQGQKTGFFLDQRDKRQALVKYCQNKNVLNCFAYTGGFSVYALAGQAKQVTNVEISQAANELAQANIKLNDFDLKKCRFITQDVKTYLSDKVDTDFDLIILDPPAFIKQRQKIQQGITGYKNINYQALRLLPSNGILFTCSCSTHLSAELFRQLLMTSAARAGKSLQMIETFYHGLDHPQLIAYREGEYLKCFVGRCL